MPLHLVTISELSLLPFLVLALSGRKPRVVSIEPLLPQLQTALTRLVDVLTARGLAVKALDECVEVGHLRGYSMTSLYYDISGKCRGWREQAFRLGQLRQLDGYGMALELVVANALFSREVATLTVSELARRPNVRWWGASESTSGLVNAYGGQNRFAASPLRVLLGRALVLPLALAAITAGMIHIFRRVETRTKERPRSFVVADQTADPRNLNVIRQLTEGGPVIVVPRDPSVLPAMSGCDFSPFTLAQPSEGSFHIEMLPATLGGLIRDTARLLKAIWALPMEIHWVAVTLAFHRMTIRGHVHKLNPRIYWARDIYNPQHILRRQELNAQGAEQWSVLHGYGALINDYPMLAHVSMDRFFVMGRAFGTKVFGDWDRNMKLIAAGGFSSDQVGLHDNNNGARDIAILTAVLAATCEPRLHDFVRKMAQAFPDRTIHLQVKSYFTNKRDTQDFVASCLAGLNNVVYVPGIPSSTLFPKVGYIFSDPSTAVLDGIRYGLPSFMIDVVPQHEQCLFRDYPGLTVASAQDAIDRVLSLETGRWRFPRERYEELIDLTPVLFADRVRAEAGLPTTGAAG